MVQYKNPGAADLKTPNNIVFKDWQIGLTHSGSWMLESYDRSNTTGHVPPLFSDLLYIGI